MDSIFNVGNVVVFLDDNDEAEAGHIKYIVSTNAIIEVNEFLMIAVPFFLLSHLGVFNDE